MSNVARIILAVLLLAVATFCLFGFIATFEPSDRNLLVWRIGYGTIALGSLVLAVWLLWLAWSRWTIKINE